nr:ComEA family DNA-binding protein [Streptomyces sp. 2131.1]
MASRSQRATSGPGRAPASDGRVRRTAGSGPGRRRRTTGRAEATAAARCRADALMAGGYGGRVARWGVGAAPAPDSGSAASDSMAPASGAAEAGGGGAEAAGAVETGMAGAVPAAAPVGRWAAAGLAVRERLPMWVQLRCGLEPRTLAALAVVLVAAAVFAGMHFWSGRPEGVRAPDVVGEAVHAPGPEADAEPEDAGRPDPSPGAVPTAGSGGQIVVDVSGKVRDPGLRRLPSGSRVDDALTAAGGARPGTDLAGLNRARVLVDGEQIVVGAPPAPVPAGGAGGPAAAGGGGPVSLNAATADQLEGLPGVGPVLAQHIVDYRTQHGGFRSVDELREVNGIGDRRFADLRPLVQP